MRWIKWHRVTKSSYGPWEYFDLGPRGEKWTDKEVDRYVQDELPGDPEGIRRSRWMRIECPPADWLAKKIKQSREQIEYTKNILRNYENLAAFVAGNASENRDANKEP